ncbi:tetratricopeptide repeat protein [Gorillibacterium timonense]|uniref:tetratricopeptide repeat protein n=1 Tax=Gorillibacterium timonense TaxID=1689269 RepID=UPI00071D2E71|nr:hypothetical protein [Gorillibacterium timonense]
MNDKEEALYEITEGTENPYGEPLKFHVPLKVVGLLVLVAVLYVICMFQFPKVLKDYQVYIMAEERLAKGETSSAIGDLSELAEKYPRSSEIMVELVDLSMKVGYYDTAAATIDNHLVGEKLGKEDYDKITRYTEQLERFYRSYDAVQKIVEASPSQNPADEAARKGMKKQLIQLLDQTDLDQAYLYYTLGAIEPDATTARDYLQKCYAIDPEQGDVRVRLSIMNRKLDDMQQASRYGQEALHKDKRDTGALRALSTISLVEGDLPQGLQYAEEAYRINPEGIYIRDTYAVALYANGKLQEAQEIKKELESSGQPLDESITRFLNGEMTLRDYYVGK